MGNSCTLGKIKINLGKVKPEDFFKDKERLLNIVKLCNWITKKNNLLTFNIGILYGYFRSMLNIDSIDICTSDINNSEKTELINIKYNDIKKSLITDYLEKKYEEACWELIKSKININKDSILTNNSYLNMTYSKYSCFKFKSSHTDFMVPDNEQLYKIDMEIISINNSIYEYIKMNYGIKFKDLVTGSDKSEKYIALHNKCIDELRGLGIISLPSGIRKIDMNNESSNLFKKKYLKYKQKYLKLSALIQIDSKKSI